MRKAVLAALAATSVLLIAAPVYAETFTTSDGVLSIDLPDETWKEIVDPEKWVALSDGANTITVEHYSNGEKLPEMSIANDHYVNVYQAVFSTQNEVFIITGSVVDAAKIPQIAGTILTAKVLKYDTRTAVSKDGYTIEPLDKTMYVTSNGLNVREGYSTSYAILGGVPYGSALKVTGKVMLNGADAGWYQVSFNNATGYVSGSFVSDTAPETEKPVSGLQFTGKACTIYSVSGAALTIYKATDGNWYDAGGGKYTWITGDKLQSPAGEQYTTYNPATTGSYPTGGSYTVYWTNGNATTLTPYSDDTLRSPEGVKYTSVGNGTYAGEDGTTLYSQIPDLTSGSQHGLSSQGSNKPAVIGQDSQGNYVDGEGILYYDQGDGTYVNEYGDVYDVVW